MICFKNSNQSNTYLFASQFWDSNLPTTFPIYEVKQLKRYVCITKYLIDLCFPLLCPLTVEKLIVGTVSRKYKNCSPYLERQTWLADFLFWPMNVCIFFFIRQNRAKISGKLFLSFVKWCTP